jgi:hypothetical protein
MPDPTTIGLLQSLLNTASAIASINDTAKRQANLVEFQKAITQAFTSIAELQLSNAALLADKQELENECVRLRDWSKEKANYSRREIGEGVFAQAPMATSNSPICGRVKIPQGGRQERLDCYSEWVALARRLAASLRR